MSETPNDWNWYGVSCGACVIAPCNDPYWPEITWHHLLQHYAGFERDPMGQDREVRDVLSAILPGPSLTLSVSLENIHEYMRRFGVEVEPGLERHYSNYGYSLLGRPIEPVSGMKYEEYVQTRILDQLCIDRMRIGSAFPTEDEVGYEDSRHRLRLTVMSEDEDTWVPRTEGGFNLANYDFHGGWTGTVVDFAALLASISTVSNSPILCSSSIETMFTSNSGKEGYKNVDSNRGRGWIFSTQYAYHEGSLPGTRAMVWRRSNGTSYTVVFNRRNRDAYGPEIHRESNLWDEALAVDDIRTIFNQLYAASPLFEWKSKLWPDLFGSYLPRTPRAPRAPSGAGGARRMQGRDHGVPYPVPSRPPARLRFVANDRLDIEMDSHSSESAVRRSATARLPTLPPLSEQARKSDPA